MTKIISLNSGCKYPNLANLSRKKKKQTKGYLVAHKMDMKAEINQAQRKVRN